MVLDMTIKYVPVSGSQALWGNKDAVLRRYEGLTIYTLNRWLAEMRENREFRNGVINPTYKLVWVNFEKFNDFLYWKQHHYLR